MRAEREKPGFHDYDRRGHDAHLKGVGACPKERQIQRRYFGPAT